MKPKITPIGDNFGYDFLGIAGSGKGISFVSRSTQDAKNRVDDIFKELDQIDKEYKYTEDLMEPIVARIEQLNTEIAKYDYIAPKMDYLIGRIRARLTELERQYSRYNKAIAELQTVKAGTQAYINKSLFLDNLEQSGLKLTASNEADEKELDNLEAILDKTVRVYEKELEPLSEQYDKYDAALGSYESRVDALNAELETLKEVSNAVEGKINREGRQLARRVKRRDKRAMKDELRAIYGKGKDYRQAKRVEKKKIKDIKKATMEKFGGSFGRRMWQGGKQIYLALPRNAFLLLTKLNVFGLATKMDAVKRKDAKAWAKLIDKWGRNWAGDVKQLEKEIERGKNKRPILNKDIRKDAKYEATGEKYYDVTGVEVLAAIADSLPIVGQVAEIVGTVVGIGLLFQNDTDPTKNPDNTPNADYLEKCIQVLNSYTIPSDVLQKMIDELNAGVTLDVILEKYGLSPRDEEKMKANGIDPKQNKDETGLSTTTLILIGAGVLIGIGLIITAFVSSKKGK